MCRSIGRPPPPSRPPLFQTLTQPEWDFPSSSSLSSSCWHFQWDTVDTALKPRSHVLRHRPNRCSPIIIRHTKNDTCHLDRSPSSNEISSFFFMNEWMNATFFSTPCRLFSLPPAAFFSMNEWKLFFFTLIKMKRGGGLCFSSSPQYVIIWLHKLSFKYLTREKGNAKAAVRELNDFTYKQLKNAKIRHTHRESLSRGIFRAV